MSKPKLLLITAISPFPKDSGGAVRIYNTIKNLSLYFELHLIFFEHPNYSLSKSDLAFLKQNCLTYHNYPQTPTSDKLSFFKYFQPFWYSQFYNKELINNLHRIINKNKIEIVQVEFTQLLYLIRYIPNYIRTIFTAHDISTLSIVRRLKTLPRLKTKIAFSLRLFEVVIYEIIYLRRFNLLCSVSEHDQQFLKKYFKLKNIINIPNGIESINFIKKTPKQKYVRLGYIGSFSHPPNETAFNFFLNNIAPLLEKEKIPYKFYLAGNNDSHIVKNQIKFSPIKNKINIINLGYISLISDFYKQIDILIAPIQSGSGTRIKILESLSFGTPVISSIIGAEGLNFQLTYLQVANSNQDYIKLIQNISNLKPNNYQQIQLTKQLKQYLWKNIFKRYVEYVLK